MIYLSGVKYSVEPIGVIHHDPYMAVQAICGDDLSDSCGTIYRSKVTCEDCLMKIMKDDEEGGNSVQG